MAAGWVLICGVAAGELVQSSRRPEPRRAELQIQNLPFHLERKPSEPFLIRPEKWLALPMLREDFDLHADVELGEGATLDFVMRRVEPRSLQGVSLPFHGRFRVLRITTGPVGQPWRTPTSALLGDGGGLSLAAGSRATVSMRARGRWVEASVAGRKWLATEAADEYGSLALIARGGVVAVQALDITPVAAGRRLPLWLVGLGAVLPMLFVGLVLRAGAGRLAVGGLAMLVGTEVARRFAFASLLPLAQPDRHSELFVLMAAAPLGLAVCLRDKIWPAAIAVALGAAVTLGWLAVCNTQERFPLTPELDALVGPDAGDHAISALARRLPGPLAVHTPESADNRVFLLGGQLLYRRGASPDEHIEPLLLGELRRDLANASVVALPTKDGWSLQQWRLFERCYTDYRPQVLVLGIPLDEAAEIVDQQPRSSPQVVADVLERARGWCADNQCELVLLADAGLADELRAPLYAAGEDLALVQVAADATPIEFARQLAAAIMSVLE